MKKATYGRYDGRQHGIVSGRMRRQCCQQRSLGSRQHQRRCLYQHRSFHFQR